MSDTTGEQAGGQPAGEMSEEQLRAYMQQLRSAPASQVVAEVLSGLLQAAQVKAGRHDARLLIDLAGLMIDHARPHLANELVTEVDRMLGQLRLTQVESEASVDRQKEENDLPAAPAPPSGEQPAGGQGSDSRSDPGGSQSSAASKLWIPGRGT